jgi:hypothetical protein
MSFIPIRDWTKNMPSARRTARPARPPRRREQDPGEEVEQRRGDDAGDDPGQPPGERVRAEVDRRRGVAVEQQELLPVGGRVVGLDVGCLADGTNPSGRRASA